MAKYRELISGEKVPPFKESSMVMFGKHEGYYVLTIGPLRVFLAPEEKYAMVQTWNNIDNGELKRGEES